MNRNHERISIRASALKALEAYMNPQRKPATAFAVRTGTGSSSFAATDTGAFRVLGRLPERERENAMIYDDDGNLLYR